jgi:hypothetical protein
MNIPFSIEQFLQVFQQYNQSVWPMQPVLVTLALLLLYATLRPRPVMNRLIAAVLALFWLWMGIVYHLVFFARINPAANYFGALFIVQALLFLYAGVVRQDLTFRFRADGFSLTGGLFILYALILYPLIGHLLGRDYPQSPTFGAPCPTTIFTFGILLWSEKKVPQYLVYIPILWGGIGFIAAATLGIREDFGLLVAAVVCGALIIYRGTKRAVAGGVA